MPFQRSWAEALQEMELKREVAGTSKIEGADFTDREFEEAIAANVPANQLTRSQRQARAAIQTYRWIATLPAGRPATEDLIRSVHRRIVTNCDDDHCAPGQLRGHDQNVTFGRPRHRGASGGAECETAFRRLCGAINQEFRSHDGLIQALAVHYHLGAIHPFQDGNGRTARAMEALLLKRAELKDTLFVTMSNHYYDEKDNYLDILTQVRASDHVLTPFLKFGLRGIAIQCKRLLREIRRHVSRSLYRDVMGQMYGRLYSTRKRALAKRQFSILERLLERDDTWTVEELFNAISKDYNNLKSAGKAFIRDVNHLSGLKAIQVNKIKQQPGRPLWSAYTVAARLEWPTEITETEFYKEMNSMPPAKTRLYIGA
jgi:cell filamentation protein, protein adenylyltransferase